MKPIEKADHSVAYFLLNQKSCHCIGTAREPGVYDPAWHNHTGPVQLSRFYAKILTKAGKEGNTDQESEIIPWAKVLGQEIEIVPLVNPHSLHVGDTFKAVLLYNGTPTEGAYSAAHET